MTDEQPWEKLARERWAAMCGDPLQGPTLDFRDGIEMGYRAGLASPSEELEKAKDLLWRSRAEGDECMRSFTPKHDDILCDEINAFLQAQGSIEGARTSPVDGAAASTPGTAAPLPEQDWNGPGNPPGEGPRRGSGI